MSLLITSLVVSFINACLPKISRIVSSLVIKKRSNIALKKEIEEVVTEMKTISISNEFPRYARLKRKLNKLTEEKQNEEKNFQNEFSSLSTKVSYVFQGIMTLFSLVMFWHFRFQAVITMPEEWLYPLDTVLSWPMQSAGKISFPVWFLITNSVSKIFAGSLTM